MSSEQDKTRTGQPEAAELAAGGDGVEDAESLPDRREFLLSLGKWSKAVVAAALFGGSLLDREGGAIAGVAWANGGRAWANRGAAWVNRGGAAASGGAWANRGGAWANGGRAWANRGGAWANGGRAWANRGGAWVNR